MSLKRVWKDSLSNLELESFNQLFFFIFNLLLAISCNRPFDDDVVIVMVFTLLL
jgi:hypothetical protein